MLEAVYYYINNQNKRFLLMMSIALPIKPLSAFIFAPLVLYREKNILKIGLQTILVFIPWIVLKLIIYPADIDAAYVLVFMLFKQKLAIGNVEIPLFVFATFVFYILCYITKFDENKYKENAIIFSFISLIIFFIVCGGNPYWYILIVPFQCLLMGINYKNALISSVLELIYSVSVIGAQIWQVPWGFDATILRSTYISKIFGNRIDDTNNILDILHKYLPGVYDLAEDRVESYFVGLFVAGISIFLFINLCRNKEFALSGKNITKDIYIIRFAIGILIAALPLIAYIF